MCAGGVIDMTTAPALREQLRVLARAGHGRVVVDLALVDSIDSTGIGALVAGLKSLRKIGGDLRLAAPGPRVATILNMAGLGSVLRSFDSAEQAFE